MGLTFNPGYFPGQATAPDGSPYLHPCRPPSVYLLAQVVSKTGRLTGWPEFTDPANGVYPAVPPNVYRQMTTVWNCTFVGNLGAAVCCVPGYPYDPSNPLQQNPIDGVYFTAGGNGNCTCTWNEAEPDNPTCTGSGSSFETSCQAIPGCTQDPPAETCEENSCIELVTDTTNFTGCAGNAAEGAVTVQSNTEEQQLCGNAPPDGVGIISGGISTTTLAAPFTEENLLEELTNDTPPLALPPEGGAAVTQWLLRQTGLGVNQQVTSFGLLCFDLIPGTTYRILLSLTRQLFADNAAPGDVETLPQIEFDFTPTKNWAAVGLDTPDEFNPFTYDWTTQAPGDFTCQEGVTPGDGDAVLGYIYTATLLGIVPGGIGYGE